jgi:CRISPR-associated protein Cmr1
MTRIEATYRITTPMFCSGADQTRAELRLPSFKGVLRFWWRSLAWGRGLRDPKQLREAEARLFGSAGDDGQSKVLLRTVQPGGQVPVVEQRHFQQNTWQGYVGFGITDGQQRPTRHYVKPGTKWTILVLIRDEAVENLEQVRDAMLAVGLVGGMGARSRKGWGSLTLERLEIVADGKLADAPWRAPESREELRKSLRRLIPNGGKGDHLPAWTAVSGRASFAVGPVLNNPEAAHHYLAERYRTAVRSITPQNEREAFGLPRRDTKKRRASPVFLHVHEIPGGPAIPVATLLPAHFLADQANPAGGWRHLETFLNSVEDT